MSSESGGPDSKYLVLVGNRFARFADDDRIFTVSDLLALATSGGRAKGGCDWTLHIGQGVECSDWATIEAVYGACDVAIHLANPGSLVARPVPPATVHKHRIENVLLADLKSGSKAHSSAALRVHNDNEFVRDLGATGQVAQMVVIEGVRQMCLANFETNYRSDFSDQAYQAIWQGIRLDFQDFCFAFPAKIVCEIVTADLRKQTNLQFRARIAVEQDERLAASAEIDYSMVEVQRISALERRKAMRAALDAISPGPERIADSGVRR